MPDTDKNVHPPTDTSKWALAIHRVSATSVEVWVGTLYPTLTMPQRARVDLLRRDKNDWNKILFKRSKFIARDQWQRPFRDVQQRFWSVAKFTGLDPDTDYKVEFWRRVEPGRWSDKRVWQHLRSGAFETLPTALPEAGAGVRPFTIGIGSCFYDHRDGGQAAGAYAALYERGKPADKPAVTFLTGDQVYLDIGLDSLSTKPSEIRQRIADDYAQHWRSLGGILNRGGTWMLPDDHEYWNDFPFYDSWLIPPLYSLKIEKVRYAWTKASKDAVNNIQRSPVVETFDIGDDLSICLADLRSHRTKTKFLRKEYFGQLVKWARKLTGPGVLVTPQPLIVSKGGTERNLRNFSGQYGRLLEALGHSGHDIVLMSGDVHFGRIATCPLGDKGGRLIEVVSSPLSNLTYLNGLATSAPEHSPTEFPPQDTDNPVWPAQPVRYSSQFDVSTRRGFKFSAYPKERTTEHFMTVSFSKASNGKVNLEAKAWRVREREGPDNTPKPDFKKPFIATLQ